MDIKHCCAFTGHRPAYFNFGYDEKHPDCVALKQEIKNNIIRLIEKGVTTYLSGMALGVDMWAAELVLELKKEHRSLRLISVLPCETQAVNWSVAQRERYYNILAECDEEIFVNRQYTRSCMMERNRYANNTKEDVEFDILPYPVFEGGKNIAVQRGAGMCVLASEPRREYAAALFLKWLTAPEQNLRMTSNMGYLPVTTEAFERMRQSEAALSDNEKIQKMLLTATAMQDSYEFLIPPVFRTYDTLADTYNDSVYELMRQDRNRYLELIRSGQSPDSAWSRVSGDAQVRLARSTDQ